MANIPEEKQPTGFFWEHKLGVTESEEPNHSVSGAEQPRLKDSPLDRTVTEGPAGSVLGCGHSLRFGLLPVLVHVPKHVVAFV